MHVLDVQVGSAGYVVSANFARELETELNKTRYALEFCLSMLEHHHKSRKGIGRLVQDTRDLLAT